MTHNLSNYFNSEKSYFNMKIAYEQIKESKRVHFKEPLVEKKYFFKKDQAIYGSLHLKKAHYVDDKSFENTQNVINLMKIHQKVNSTVSTCLFLG